MVMRNNPKKMSCLDIKKILYYNFSVPKKKYDMTEKDGIMELVERLLHFGLTRQEATIYLKLLTVDAMTGYEVAKQTGISRSNSYSALAGLVEKGASYMIEGAGTKYVAVDMEEFCSNYMKHLEEHKRQLVENAPIRSQESNGYITVCGKEHILDKLRNMITEAKERIYISLTLNVMREVEQELEAAADRGIKVVVLMQDESYKNEHFILYYNKESSIEFGLIVDTTTVLTGTVKEKEGSTSLYSKNRNLVVVFKEMLKNQIKLVTLHDVQSANGRI